VGQRVRLLGYTSETSFLRRHCTKENYDELLERLGKTSGNAKNIPRENRRIFTKGGLFREAWDRIHSLTAPSPFLHLALSISKESSKEQGAKAPVSRRETPRPSRVVYRPLGRGSEPFFKAQVDGYKTKRNGYAPADDSDTASLDDDEPPDIPPLGGLRSTGSIPQPPRIAHQRTPPESLQRTSQRK